MLGLGSDDEDEIELSESQRRQLIKRLKKDADSRNAGIRDKVGRVLRDFSKRGQPGETSALSILVGPPEGARSTEGFILGETDDVHGSVSEFITGKDHESPSSKPFSFDEVIGGGDGGGSDDEWFKNGIV